MNSKQNNIESILLAIITICACLTAAAQPTVSFSRVGTTNTLFWWGEAWTDYTVLSSTNLTDWQTDGNMSGDGNEKGAYTYVAVSTDSHKFYRVKTGNVVPHANITLDASSPSAEIIQISETVMTPNVCLGVYAVKMTAAPGTMMNFAVNVKTAGADVTTVFSNIRIHVGSTSYAAAQIGLPGENGTNMTVIFNNLTIALPADTSVPVAIFGDVSPNTDSKLFEGATVTKSVNAWGTPASDNQYRHTPNIMDAEYETVPVGESYVQTSMLTFTSSPAHISNEFTTHGPAIVTIANGSDIVGYPVTFSFWITAGNQPIFVSCDPTRFVEWGVMPGTAADLAFPFGSIVTNPEAGDSNVTSPSRYFIVAPGASRQFTLNGFLRNNGLGHTETAWISGVFFGKSSDTIGVNEIPPTDQNLRLSVEF